MTQEEKKPEVPAAIPFDSKRFQDEIYAEVRRLQKEGNSVPKDFAKQILKSFYEAALKAEMTEHLGYEKHATEGRNSDNSRNGTTSKKIRGAFGEIELNVPLLA